jgi:subtilase family serine protease
LDVEWAGAVAPNATIDFVTSESTETSLGVDLSAEYIVDNNLAPILSESYGSCELFLGTTGNEFYNQLWQQASAQGITVLVATGDSGSAVCDRNAGTQGAAKFGLSVSGFSSTPYNVAVGGTDFNDLTNPSTYWAVTNSAPPLPGNPSALATVSALSYIPETTWNDTCTNSVFGTILSGYSTNPETNCNNSLLINDGFLLPVGGSGGKSGCTNSNGETVSSCSGGYAKPSWQTGAGVPNDGKRDVPDVSLYAAINSPSGSFYVVCEADFNPGSVSCDPTNLNTDFLAVGGTSASTPAFAGIIALVNQETQSRQGNVNYVLYKLAAQQAGAFNDVPAGGTIAMPCATGSTSDCVTSIFGDKYGVLSGYSTTSGYDLATGLGSVNANNLVTKWSTATTGSKGSATSLTISPATSPIPHGTAVPITITVTPNPFSSSTPTGLVSLITSNGQSAGSFTLGGNGSIAPGTTASLLPGGSYTVTAHYAGDGNFAASDSTPPVAVTVAPEASKTQVLIEAFNPSTGQVTNPNVTTISSGPSYFLRVNVNGASGACAQNSGANPGCPTDSVTVTDDGDPLDAGTYKLNSQGYAEDQLIALQAGPHSLVATYGGDSSYNSSTSPTDVVTVTEIPTTIGLAAPSPQVTQSGSIVTLTAAVTGQTAPPSPFPGPTGTVRFSVGSAPIQLGSSATVTYTSRTLTGGFIQLTATLSISSLPNGIDSITAQYLGDSNYAASPLSSPQQVQIQIPTNTTLSSSSASIPLGANLTLTARVTQTLPGGPGPTGTVQFTQSEVNGQIIGSAPISGGQAQLTTSALPADTFEIWATYSGDTNYAASYASIPQNVVGLSTRTTLVSSNLTPTPGSNVTFTAQVAPVQSGGPPLTGGINFEAPVGNTIAFVPLSNGQAQTTWAFQAGSTAVLAMYNGDTTYAQSSASVTEVAPAIGDSMVLTSSNPTIVQGTAVTFTVQITPAIPNGPDLSSGNVSFTANGSPIGVATMTYDGQTQLTTSSLPPGSVQIQAVFSNSFYYASSTASITETVTPVVVLPPTFSVTANPTAINVSAPGQTGSTVLTFTSQNGLAGMSLTVSAGCSLFPSESSCSFSPTSVVTSTTINLPANGSTTATFYVLTTAPSATVPTTRNRPVSFGRWTTREVTILASVLCFGMLVLGFRGRRLRLSTAFAILALALVIANAACGGGGSNTGGGGGGGGGNPGTPLTQNAPIGVSIMIGGISQTVPNLTITVQ